MKIEEYDMDDVDYDCFEKIDPVCPYCKKENAIDWDIDSPILAAGEEWEHQCVSCGEKYPVQTMVKYFFTTVKYENELYRGTNKK